jgi:RNA polymerase sigma-70 factor (ECF subfamily)
VEPDVSALRRGDAAALEQCYRAHASRLRTTALRLTASVADAEDVVHDLFLRLPQALVGYEPQGKFGSWITTLTIRQALMHERRERVRAHRSLGAEHDRAAPTVDGDVVAGERVMAALQSLTAALRHVFVLRAVHEYTHPEIATMLGITTNSSEVRMHRAVQQLRQLLGDLR